jgi:hypothetical protein
MRVRVSRREFLADGAVAQATVSPLTRGAAWASQPLDLENSPFRIAVINDEITQDFGRACEVASQHFGMQWIELRSIRNKNVVNLEASEVLAPSWLPVTT